MDTLIIGLDGGEWDIIDAIRGSGRLQNLTRLEQRGTSGPLTSITPPVSPPAWNSIHTGTNPGKHGIFDFLSFDEDYGRRSVDAADRTATPFWEVLNDHGTSTGLFKLPFTYPLDDVDGFAVAGFPTPETVNDYATPDGVTDRAGPLDALFEDWSLQQAGDYAAFRDDLLAVVNHQTDAFLDLVEAFNTDLGMVVYDGTDRVQHFFWKYHDETHPRHDPDTDLAGAIKDLYAAVDDGIGRILKAVNDDCDVVVLSDHGFGPLTHDVYVDEWLEREGFLARRSPESRRGRAQDALGMLLKVVWGSVARLGLADVVSTVVPQRAIDQGMALQDAHRDVAWDETEAFFTTLSGQALYVNLEGSFADGIIPDDERDKVIEHLRLSLLSLSHPKTGEPLVEEIVRTDERFEGWRVKDAPDLVVRTDPTVTLKGGRSDDLVAPSAQYGHDRSGDHRTDGILIASGPSFDEGTVKGASVLDIAPTLLHLHGSPVPEVMDGSVLAPLFTSELREDRSVERTDAYGATTAGDHRFTDEEAEQLEERLSNMGYLG